MPHYKVDNGILAIRNLRLERHGLYETFSTESWAQHSSSEPPYLLMRTKIKEGRKKERRKEGKKGGSREGRGEEGRKKERKKEELYHSTNGVAEWLKCLILHINLEEDISDL
jgi:hypothetical protein